MALDPPAPKLAAALGIPLEEAERRMRAEIAYYRAHMHTLALDELRERCAEIVGADVPTLLSVITFTPFGDVVPALTRWRARGLRLVVVSNWDASLPEVLARTGLDVLVDGVVSSADVGAVKPDPAPLRAGMEIAGTKDTWLIGDDVKADAGAAAAAGIPFVHVDRPQTDLSTVLP